MDYREAACAGRITVDDSHRLLQMPMSGLTYFLISTVKDGVELDFSRPGKPTDNSIIEALNGPFQQECLNENWFLSL